MVMQYGAMCVKQIKWKVHATDKDSCKPSFRASTCQMELKPRAWKFLPMRTCLPRRIEFVTGTLWLRGLQQDVIGP
ncbi:hypothetical protein DBR12_06130 [Acidovorax sp. HMWF029]|nr:hypothetical protein DBR12_06130 [Acidovorax sp. HMWF029]